ncbi:hypothetical protein FIBSPDRAFT_28468 [Athelia psychrophila]|uniref:Uncharacterized protein n=1 Tax=Athelia psychrophila TaxID=1759441 RepID=A0A167T2T4_9AGAM|nr:hypothetical protein FIBSPDRAFT_28468 [Fibularhizoctonia sp. CBS 109695]
MRQRLYVDQHEAPMHPQPSKKSLTAVASFLPHSAMANNALEYPPSADALPASMLATSSEVPILGIKRARSTNSDKGQRQRPRHESRVSACI